MRHPKKQEDKEYWNDAAGAMVKWYSYFAILIAVVLGLKMFFGIWS